jgi:hypothetical protein
LLLTNRRYSNMPFDGAIPTPSAAIIAIDDMIEFFNSRSDSWTRGRLCKGDRRNPTSVCLRGALNYVAFGNAKSFYLWQRKNRDLWYEVDRAMADVSASWYGSRQYISINDSSFTNRGDAILFLRRARDCLQAA